MKVVVIGQGYVGLNIAVSAAVIYQVIGFDNNEFLVKELNNGNSHIEDISSEILKTMLLTKNYKASNKFVDISEADVYVIAVPTPLNNLREPDLSFVEKAAETISKVATKPALIINESTSFPGTLTQIIKKKIDSNSNLKHMYAASPERVDPGRTDFTQKNTPRLIGGIDEHSQKAAVDFYSAFCDEIIEVDSPEVAETAKLFENTFRQVNIALVNELAIICNSLKINVHNVINAANTKPYGFMKFTPGPGVGGHCIPVDPTYLAYRAEQAGVEARFIDLANRVNLDMPRYVISRCEQLIGTLAGKKVLISGVAYKPNIADVRETPAELLRQVALEKGASVSWFDPIVDNWEPGKVDILGQEQFDLVIFQTLHAQMNVNEIKKSAKVAFDCTGKVPGIASI